jgi:hypothetical protein
LGPVGRRRNRGKIDDVITDAREARVSRLRPTVGSREWELDIYRHVADHGQTEGEILQEYQQLADEQDVPPAFAYLARIILDDEVRHHRIFDDLAENMRRMVEESADEGPIPSLRGFHTDRMRILRLTEQLLAVERADERELKDLAKRVRDFDKVTLWGLLLELMIDDTRKHIKILKFIRDRAKDQPD